MSALSSPFVRWGVGAIAFVGILATLRFQPWQRPIPVASAPRETLAVGFLPVTCHLTCPVTDYASRTSHATRFDSQRFTDFPTVVETVKSGRLDATFMIAPLAMKLREQGVKSGLPTSGTGMDPPSSCARTLRPGPSGTSRDACLRSPANTATSTSSSAS